MYVHEVLVNHLGGLSLPRKRVIRLTDRPDMIIDVCHGHRNNNTTTATLLMMANIHMTIVQVEAGRAKMLKDMKKKMALTKMATESNWP